MATQAVLVTGAGSGIGRGIAEFLAAVGWHVAVNDLVPELAEDVAEATGGVAVPGDVVEHHTSIVRQAVEAVGPLHGLVNNAGALQRAPLSEVTSVDLDRTYKLNVRAPVLLAQAALPSLVSTHGAVVNISSISMLSPQTFGGLYAPSKAALSSFTAQAAIEWGPLGVRVNAVAPGMTWTSMTDNVYSNAVHRQQREELVPLRRIGTPEDVAGVVEFLLSPAAGYVTGQTLVVDGGYTHTLVHSLPISTTDSLREQP